MQCKRATEAKATRLRERAREQKTTRTPERATLTKTTKARKRASTRKTTRISKRAMCSETTKLSKRARDRKTTRTSERFMIDRLNLRTTVRGAYDIQKLRIQMGNRIVGNFKAKLGQAPGKKEEELSAEDKNLLDDLRARFKKLTDGVKTFPTKAKFKGDEVISTYTELSLLAMYVGLERDESQHFRRLEKILEEFAVWTEFLKGVKGIGPAMAGVIISEFDIHKARYPSSMWRYAGLDVADDGYARSRREEHLVEVEYTNKDGEPAKRRSITYNPWLRTKLLGVLGGSFIKCASPYAKIYADYKHRMESHDQWGTQNDGKKDDGGKFITSKMRRHKQAIRYMVKMFLIDLYNVWRGLEGLPVEVPYHEAKLGKVHGERAIA